MGSVLLGRFGGLGLVDAYGNPCGGPGQRPCAASTQPAETRTAAELTSAGAGRVAGNVLARQIISAGGSSADIRMANAAGAAAYQAQETVAASGGTVEQQAAAGEEAVRATVAAQQEGKPVDPIATGNAAAAKVVGSNTLYYVAGGLVVIGLIGTLVIYRKRSAPMPRPALAGYNRRRKHKRSAWIR